jgi:predicted negative regulator of RcsB-dependent stress response
MAVDIDDNEQNEKLRDIWINYKNFILIGLGLLLAIYFGFTFLANQETKRNEIASQLYQEILIEKIENLENIQLKTNSLKKDHLDTPYAGRASLHLGQLLGKSNKHEESINELKWASDKAKEVSIQSLARYTLSTTYLAMKVYKNAKMAAESIASNGFNALKMDLMGDIYLLEGNVDRAKESFTIALEFYKDKNELAQVIQSKIDALGK